jgi:hypothetical protein
MAYRAVVFRAAGYGLANRLRALAGYQALARLLDLPFYLCWVCDPACQSRFEDLFATPLNLMNWPEVEQLGPEAVIFHEGIWFDEIWKRAGSNAFGWQQYLAEVHRCLRELVPRRELLQTVEDFSSRRRLAEALGIHIRHTDNLSVYSQWAAESSDFDSRRISSLDGFLDVIRTHMSTMPVFLATDDNGLEGRLRKIFPDLVVFPKEYAPAGFRTTQIADALSEMLLLGRCSRIVGTYYSSFSKFSAIWSGAPYFEVVGCEHARSDFVDRMLAPATAVPGRPARPVEKL